MVTAVPWLTESFCTHTHTQTCALEQFLRVILNAVSWTIVLILLQIKLNSQLSRCAFFFFFKEGRSFSDYSAQSPNQAWYLQKYPSAVNQFSDLYSRPKERRWNRDKKDSFAYVHIVGTFKTFKTERALLQQTLQSGLLVYTSEPWFSRL